jgi:hypothetical protein
MSVITSACPGRSDVCPKIASARESTSCALLGICAGIAVLNTPPP